MPVNNDYISINNWGDVSPFVGSFVAYQTSDFYFNKKDVYHFEDQTVCYGYIKNKVDNWSSSEHGYSVEVVSIHGKYSTYALTNSKLIDANLRMRLATKDEIKKCNNEVMNNRAWLNSYSVYYPEKVQKIFDSCISKASD
ncbi:MAG: hypothetical protein WC222_08825 [Parachlamydiales bacterium]|jgi:hypothetical protein